MNELFLASVSLHDLLGPFYLLLFICYHHNFTVLIMFSFILFFFFYYYFPCLMVSFVTF